MWKKAFLIAGLVTFIVAPTSAQGLKFGPQIGFQKATDATKGDFLLGAALRAKLMPLIGVEGSIGYRQEKFSNDVLTVRSWPVMVTGLIYPLPMVYGAIGAGWHNTTFDYDQSKLPTQGIQDETKQEFGWHFGAGVELPLGERFKLTGDFRYVFLNYEFNNIPGSGDVNSDAYFITGGFLFGL